MTDSLPGRPTAQDLEAMRGIRDARTAPPILSSVPNPRGNLNDLRITYFRKECRCDAGATWGELRYHRAEVGAEWGKPHLATIELIPGPSCDECGKAWSVSPTPKEGDT